MSREKGTLHGNKYDSITFQDENFKISVIIGQSSKNTDIRNTEKTFHEEIEIKYFFEGESTLIIGSDVIVTKPGDISVVNPYEIHATIDSENGKYHLIDIDIDFVRNPDLRNLLLGGGIKFNSHIKDNKRLQEIILLVIEEMTNKRNYYRTVVHGLMTEFFSLMLREETKNISDSESNLNTYSMELIAPAFCKIHVDYNKKITIDELAKLCNITKYHFCRIFRKTVGITAMQYLLSYRLKIADVMLKNSDRKIFEISSMCGFEDECYFCRCYKKVKGISPRKFREEISAESD